MNISVDDIVNKYIENNPAYVIDALYAYLIYNNNRKAALVETVNWRLNTLNQRNKQILDIYENLLKHLDLVYIYDEISLHKYPRWFITKNHDLEEINNLNLKKTNESIAHILDFFEKYDDFSDTTKKRVNGQIFASKEKKSYCLTAEVYNKNKIDINKFKNYLEKKTSMWDLTLSKLGFKCSYSLKDMK